MALVGGAFYFYFSHNSGTSSIDSGQSGLLDGIQPLEPPKKDPEPPAEEPAKVVLSDKRVTDATCGFSFLPPAGWESMGDELVWVRETFSIFNYTCFMDSMLPTDLDTFMNEMIAPNGLVDAELMERVTFVKESVKMEIDKVKVDGGREARVGHGQGRAIDMEKLIKMGKAAFPDGPPIVAARMVMLIVDGGFNSYGKKYDIFLATIPETNWVKYGNSLMTSLRTYQSKIPVTGSVVPKFSCAGWPSLATDIPSRNFVPGDKSSLASDIPIFSGAEVFGADPNAPAMTGFCVDKKLSEVSDYYTSLKGDWTFSQPFADVNRIITGSDGKTTKGLVRVLIGKQGADRKIQIHFYDLGDHTALIVKSEADYQM
jgi:hypothetical protein